MTDQKELESIIERLRSVGGIVRTKHDASDAIIGVSIGKLPGSKYRRLGEPGTGWLPPIAAAERMREALAKVCGIQHKLGGQVCMRAAGHDGLCRCKAARGSGGTITYSEWESRDGQFYRHVGYHTIYPANARSLA